MQYKKIDINLWHRKTHYLAYREIQCGFSITQDIDITAVLHYQKKQGYKFYPLMIHILSEVVNQHPAFKLRLRGGDLVEWETVHPSYTIFQAESETFSGIWTPYQPDIDLFMRDYNADTVKYGNCIHIAPKPDAPENTFYISSLPWTGFTGFHLNFAAAGDVFTPIFTFGKYEEKAGRILLPLAIQVHHAVCDGYHAGKLIQALEQRCAEYDL